MRILVCVTFVIALALADPVQYKDCGSVSGTIESVDITPCPTLPCLLKHKSNITLVTKFKSNVDTEKAKTVVHGVIAGIPTPFPMPDDACSNNNVACPIRSGSDLTYRNNLYVLPEYPKISVIVKWELQDQNGKDLFCFAVPAQITD